MKKTAQKIQKYKALGKKITALTAYDFPTAKYFDKAGVDIILVGDSLAQVGLGYDSTVRVSVEEMKIFTAAVYRAVNDALVVVDMPFFSYHTGIFEGAKVAAEFVRTGANAVKIEGGSDYIIELTKHLTESGVPVMSHLGFTPQYINSIGGNFIQGKSLENAVKILEQAKKLQEAGAFSIVLEMVPTEAAKFISENLEIPTIGIGAGKYCDGQILVCNDVLGKFDDFVPKFARKYANLREIITDAAKSYMDDVQTGAFPSAEESFALDENERIKLENYKQNI